MKKGQKCQGCGQGEEEVLGQTLSLCSGCVGVAYCGLACQREDWARHKSTCRGRKKKSRNKSRSLAREEGKAK